MHQPNAELCSRRRNIVIDIEQELQNLPRISDECCIYRVSKRLVNIQPTAYEPQFISIGPFHHGRQDLKPSEQFKLQFLRRFLFRITRGRWRQRYPIEKVAIAALRWETKAREYYEDFAINMNSHDFVKMMLVDGCFIVEFLVAIYGGNKLDLTHHDPLIFKAMNINLYHDLIMLENQLPFFVLQGLFRFLPKTKNSIITPLKEVIHKFFQANFMKHYYLKIPQNMPLETNNIKHLVNFLGFYYSPPTRHIIQGNNHLLTLPPSTTELYEAGVIFEKASTINYNSLVITFKDGVLKIPPFEIHGLFEISMRNLIAFENFQGGKGSNQSYSIHYVLFLEALISSEKDSNILMKKGIISNLIGGSDEEVSNMFNNLGKGVTIQGDFYYENVCKNLRKHCEERRNQWKTSLRRRYFNTPWAVISLFAAIYFFLVTFLQSIFAGFNIRMVLHNT